MGFQVTITYGITSCYGALQSWFPYSFPSKLRPGGYRDPEGGPSRNVRYFGVTSACGCLVISTDGLIFVRGDLRPR